MKSLFSFLCIILLFAGHAIAEPIIRDTELEVNIRMIANPIFKAAGYKPEDIQIYIVNNPEINAYVSGGRNMFIHTGLLTVARDPNMLMGVIAHETGHIYGGHLFKGEQEAKNNVVKATAGYMLGLAAAVAGSPQGAAAIISGTQQVVSRQSLQHSRGNEDAADNSGLIFLDKAGYSSKGMLDVLQVLYGKEVIMYGEINPYTLTHPLSRERIDHVRAHLEKSSLSEKSLPPYIAVSYVRSIIKLDAFLEPTEVTLNKYPAIDKSVNARYARAIAYYKIPDLQKSISEIDSLIKQFPKDAFFIELKGQILFENGRVVEAINCYEKSNALLQNAALLKIQLATAQIASENETYLKPAVANLEQALHNEKYNNFAWSQLGVAYGRLGELDMSNLALAQAAELNGDKEGAKRFIRIARQTASPGSSVDLRLKDLENAIADNKENKQ
jgi:Zn-dependent protease with chaperone function